MFESLSIARSAGAVTSARRYQAVHPRASLILAHGAGAGQTHPFLVRLATDLAARAIAVLTFNFPYIDRKRGAPDSPAVLEDCYLDVIRFARQSLDGPLLIGGKSMGGRIATQVAARADFGGGVAGIVILGYPLHPPGKPDVLRVKHLSSIQVPMLVIQGTRDTFGSPDELRPYFEPHGSRVLIHPIDRGDHSFVVPKAAGRPQSEVNKEVVDVIAGWIPTLSVR